MNTITEQKRICKCGKEYHKPYTCSKKMWNERYKFCSISCAKKGNKNLLGKSHTAWNKGTKGLQVAWNKGKSEYAKKLGFGLWMNGKKLTPETRKKQSITHKQRVARGENNFYIDGRTPEIRTIRHSLEYKLWREAVFERDNYTCIWCGARCGNGKKIVLNADHIQLFADKPELRFAIDNGRTLCQECHYKRHSNQPTL